MAVSPDTVAWLRAYYEAIDGMRFDEVAEFVHEECVTVYPNGAVAAGREKLVRGMQRGLGALARIRHELKNVWDEGDELIFELEVTYSRRDGETIVRPGAGIFVLKAGKIIQQRLFVDASGVWD